MGGSGQRGRRGGEKRAGVWMEDAGNGTCRASGAARPRGGRPPAPPLPSPGWPGSAPPPRAEPGRRGGARPTVPAAGHRGPRYARGGAGLDTAGGGARGMGAGEGGRSAATGPPGTRGCRPPPPPLTASPHQRGLARNVGARPPGRDVRARRNRSRGPGRACTVPPHVVRRRPSCSAQRSDHA